MPKKLSISPFAPICWACAALMMPPERTLCFAAALAVHEAAHLCVMKAFGICVDEVRVRAAGLEIIRGGGATSYVRDAAVSLAGPAASAISGWAGLAAGGVFGIYGILSLILGAFNALPVCGLDGGYAFRSLLSAVMPPERADQIARAVSFAFVAALWAAGVYVMLADGGFSLFLISCTLFVSQAFGA